MFKGQFLATALSAYFNASLASTGIAVSPSSLYGTTCMTAPQLLTFGNATCATLSANKIVSPRFVRHAFYAQIESSGSTCSRSSFV